MPPSEPPVPADAAADTRPREARDAAAPREDAATASPDAALAGPDAGTSRADGGASSGVDGAALRDPYLWPFASTSIWNMPIGSGAVWKPARLEAAKAVGADIQHVLRLDARDPVRPVLGSTTFGPGRCAGTTPTGLSFPVPDDWTVPDAGKENPYGLTPNSNFAFLLPDGETLFEGNVLARCTPAGPIHMPDWVRFPNNQKRQSVRGDGLGGGGQGASGMSAMGGTIRLGELSGKAPFKHAVKLNPWAKKYLHYSDAVKGFRWPAKAADGYAKDPGEYDPASFGRADDPSLVMGTLLAIPPTVTEASMGLATEPGRRLFRALQDYGAYITEDAAWDTWDLVVERGVEKEMEAAGLAMSGSRWKEELNKLVQALQIVDNNGPTTIGGGGTPRVPLAPAIAP